jgi:hypothetical protein
MADTDTASQTQAAKAEDALRDLPPEVAREVSARVLGSPSRWATDAIWIIVMAILAGVIFFFGWQGIKSGGSDETALFGFVGLALGAVIGVLAPTPPVVGKNA